MVKAIRHGDMALILINKLPDGLTHSKTDVLMRGSHNNAHRFTKGISYQKNEGNFIIGYFEALKGCKLLHPEHGTGKGKEKEAKIPIGLYQVRKQNEVLANELKQVVD